MPMPKGSSIRIPRIPFSRVLLLIVMFESPPNITINSNTLLNGMRGIRIDDPFGIGINTNVVAHQNCITGNTIAGMEVEPGGYPITPQLNAESNWWGHASGPMEIP